MESSIFQVLPKDMINQILSNLDTQSIKTFGQTSKISHQITEEFLEPRRKSILQTYIKRYNGFLVKQINKFTVLMANTTLSGAKPIINSKTINILHYQINLDFMIKTLISQTEYIKKAYPKNN